MIRRSGCFYLALILAFVSVLFRTFWLSLGDNAQRAQDVISKRESSLVLYRTKGVIYDENLNPIAGDQPCWYLVVNPRDFQQEDLDQLLTETDADRTSVWNKLQQETPFVLMAKEKPEAMPGVNLFQGMSRYSAVAAHLLGYLDSAGEVGLSGVEKEYNDYLNLFSSTVRVSYNADAMRGAIAGLGMETKDAEISDNGLVLTLNAQICQALDSAMDQYVPMGAAVVADCRTGEIKAVSSKPGYDENKIASYLQSSSGELINRAFSAQLVGSVFKIIVAACALEAGLENFTYTCQGGIVINDRTFACHNQSGHGTVDMQEAFAQSCNAYFIALGQLLGYDRIAEMAKRFGFGTSIAVLSSMVASAGTFPEKSNNLALANLSIGQGELTASPLQVARMTAVVANGGVMPAFTLYKGLYLNGSLKTDGVLKEGTRILSEEVAKKLWSYCLYTVEHGTGQSAKPSVGSAGGKTASAQTGVVVNGVEKLNVYFTGFYPAENPRYVITVFAEDGESGGKTCAPVFREMCDFIAENGLTG